MREEILCLIGKLTQLKEVDKSLFEYLVEVFVKRWPITKKLEIPVIP